MKTSDFDYPLPPERIAQTPVEPRHNSRLLVLRRSPPHLEHSAFSAWANICAPAICW